MDSPKTLYKSWHPDLFSDSVEQEVPELDRSLLEFHLGTLTSKMQEADFEHFARRLCEQEICPNLVPTTGPTGGGDSKADSETFPVSPLISLSWFHANADAAASERWAFAFSAKAKWQPKVESDVEKIVATNRGYKKVFYVSNQAVKASKRAQVEDALSQKYGVEVRILDRTWILERVFAGHHEQIAIDELKVTGLSRSKPIVGPTDAARLSQVKQAEERLKQEIKSGQWGLSTIDDALEIANNLRSLEKPRDILEAAYTRADKLAMERGTGRQQVEAAYQWAWTLFWWIEDIPAVFTQYAVVEERAKDSENVYDLERLTTLWGVLNTHAFRYNNADWMERAGAAKPVLVAALERLANNEERPSNSLQAKALALRIELFERLRLDADVESVLSEFRNVLKEAQRLIGFPVEQMIQIIQEAGKVLTDSPIYDELLQEVVESASKRDGEIRSARLLLERGQQYLDKKQPAKSVAMIGQALGRLYKHETRQEIVAGLFSCGMAYEQVGLLWAARSVYLTGVGIAVDEFWRFSKPTPALVLCAESLRCVEAVLGRLPQSLAWHEFYSVARQALSNEQLNEKLATYRDSKFEAILSRLLIRTPHEKLSSLIRLPDTLDKMGLHVAADVLLFALGYGERLQGLATEEEVDALATKIWSLDADIPLASAPTTYSEQEVTLASKILGCNVKIQCSTDPFCVEVAELLLATLESLLATSIISQAMPIETEITGQVSIDTGMAEALNVTWDERLGRPYLLIGCPPVSPYNLPSNKWEGIRESISDAAIELLSQMVMFRDMEKDIKNLFVGERVTERASAFTGGVEAIRNVHGQQPRFRLSAWDSDSITEHTLLRIAPWEPLPGERIDPEEPENREVQFGQGEPPEGLLDPNSLAHHEMTVVSPIRLNLWDQAKWRGAGYIIDPSYREPPVLGFIFENEEAARKIFQAWRSEIGLIDSKRVLRITIIRGINKNAPFNYRLLVTGNLSTRLMSSKVVALLSRMQTMERKEIGNLESFLEAFGRCKRFTLMPLAMKNGMPFPIEDCEIEILEINDKQAWEIGRNDIDGMGIILEEDDVIIPSAVPAAPVTELLEQKRKLRGK